MPATGQVKSSGKFEPTFGVENAGETLYPSRVGINSPQFEA
jgi:hypothetical protein